MEHLHLSNVVHCNLSAMSFMRFYDGIYRIIDVQDSRLGSEFYGILNIEVGLHRVVFPLIVLRAV